jgi:hypothetical protein
MRRIPMANSLKTGRRGLSDKPSAGFVPMLKYLYLEVFFVFLEDSAC